MFTLCDIYVEKIELKSNYNRLDLILLYTSRLGVSAKYTMRFSIKYTKNLLERGINSQYQVIMTDKFFMKEFRKEVRGKVFREIPQLERLVYKIVS